MHKEDMVPIATEYYSARKKNKIMPFTLTWTDLEMIMLSEVSQKEKDKSHVISHMWNWKHIANELIYETETLTDIEQTCGCQGGGTSCGCQGGWIGSSGLTDADYYL